MLGKYGETLVVDWGLAKTLGINRQRFFGSDENEEPTLTPSGSNDGFTVQGSMIWNCGVCSTGTTQWRSSECERAIDVYGLGAIYMSCSLAGPSTRRHPSSYRQSSRPGPDSVPTIRSTASPPCPRRDLHKVTRATSRVSIRLRA